MSNLIDKQAWRKTLSEVRYYNLAHYKRGESILKNTKFVFS